MSNFVYLYLITVTYFKIEIKKRSRKRSFRVRSGDLLSTSISSQTVLTLSLGGVDY
jgi:hypothetical protein